MNRTFLDWSDPAAVRSFLLDAHRHVDDIDAAIQDTFLPPDERELGPALVRENYGSSMRSLVFLLEYAIGPEGFPNAPAADGGEPGEGDPEP